MARWTSNMPPRQWTPDEDQSLAKLRGLGHGRDVIAQIMGRSPGSIESRMRKLKLVAGFSSSRAWSERRAVHGPAGKPLDLEEGDDRYVRAVMAAGGFARRVRLSDGTTVEVRPSVRTYMEPHR